MHIKITLILFCRCCSFVATHSPPLFLTPCMQHKICRIAQNVCECECNIMHTIRSLGWGGVKQKNGYRGDANCNLCILYERKTAPAHKFRISIVFNPLCIRISYPGILFTEQLTCLKCSLKAFCREMCVCEASFVLHFNRHSLN